MCKGLFSFNVEVRDGGRPAFRHRLARFRPPPFLGIDYRDRVFSFFFFALCHDAQAKQYRISRSPCSLFLLFFTLRSYEMVSGWGVTHGGFSCSAGFFLFVLIVCWRRRTGFSYSPIASLVDARRSVGGRRPVCMARRLPRRYIIGGRRERWTWVVGSPKTLPPPTHCLLGSTREKQGGPDGCYSHPLVMLRTR